MSNIDDEMNRRLDDTYERVKPYLKNSCPELKEMCKICECWYAEKHDYEECKNKPCFRFWLSYECMKYDIGWDISPGI